MPVNFPSIWIIKTVLLNISIDHFKLHASQPMNLYLWWNMYFVVFCTWIKERLLLYMDFCFGEMNSEYSCQFWYAAYSVGNKTSDSRSVILWSNTLSSNYVFVMRELSFLELCSLFRNPAKMCENPPLLTSSISFHPLRKADSMPV